MIISVTAVFAAAMISAAQNRGDINITHGPWLTGMTDNAVTVVWKTDRPALSWVEFAKDTGEHFYADAHERRYDSAHGRRICLDTLHRVRLTGLKPGTVYCYRIFSQVTEGWDYSDYVKLGNIASSSVYKKEPYRFRTFDPDAETVSFFVLNDIHGRSGDMRKMCSGVDFKKYDFVLLNGDMCTVTESEDDMFNGWLDAAVDMFATDVPIVFARGNHENRGRFADSCFRYFPAPGGEFYYRFNVGNTEFIVLDGGEDKPDSDIEYGGIAEFDAYREAESEWLKGVAENRTGECRIVFLHIPPTSSSWHGDRHIQKNFLPALDGEGVSLMLSGHTHRNMLIEPAESHDYPILVNGNRSSLSVQVGNGNIAVTVAGEDGKTIKKHNFRIRK